MIVSNTSECGRGRYYFLSKTLSSESLMFGLRNQIFACPVNFDHFCFQTSSELCRGPLSAALIVIHPRHCTLSEVVCHVT